MQCVDNEGCLLSIRGLISVRGIAPALWDCQATGRDANTVMQIKWFPMPWPLKHVARSLHHPTFFRPLSFPAHHSEQPFSCLPLLCATAVALILKMCACVWKTQIPEQVVKIKEVDWMINSLPFLVNHCRGALVNVHLLRSSSVSRKLRQRGTIFFTHFNLCKCAS